MEDIFIDGFTDVKEAIKATMFDAMKDVKARVDWTKAWQQGLVIGSQWELPAVSGWPVRTHPDENTFVHGIPPCECAMLISPPDNRGKVNMETTVDAYIRVFGDIPPYCSVYLTLLCYPDNEGMDCHQVSRYISKATKVDHFTRSEASASAKNMMKTIVMGGFNLAVYKSNMRMITSANDTDQHIETTYPDRVR